MLCRLKDRSTQWYNAVQKEMEERKNTVKDLQMVQDWLVAAMTLLSELELKSNTERLQVGSMTTISVGVLTVDLQTIYYWMLWVWTCDITKKCTMAQLCGKDWSYWNVNKFLLMLVFCSIYIMYDVLLPDWYVISCIRGCYSYPIWEGIFWWARWDPGGALCSSSKAGKWEPVTEPSFTFVGTEKVGELVIQWVRTWRLYI